MQYLKIIIRLLLIFLIISITSMDGLSQNWFSKKSKEELPDKQLGPIQFTNTDLVTQDGTPVNFQEFIKGKVVAINFIFTKCKTICPPMGANFASLVREMNCVDPDGEFSKLISLSIDPRNDTPSRLKKWSENFGAPDNWTLLTGKKDAVDQLLKDLKVFTPLKEDHAPIILIGKEGGYDWLRTNGLAPVSKLKPELESLLADEGNLPSSEEIEDRSYFTDLKLTDQHSEEHRFYTDLLKDKVVIINPFFGDCKGSCPMMHSSLMQVQQYLGDRMGRDVHILSITVDPENDTPERLNEYAHNYGAQEGWHFLTGSNENLTPILKKLGKYVENREEHDTIFLMGNTKTRLWKKVNGLSSEKEIINILNSVLNDQGT